MVDKKNIGKIQIIVGVVILVIGLLCSFYLIPLKKSSEEKMNTLNFAFQESLNQTENVSEDVRLTESIYFVEEASRANYNYNNQKSLILLSSLILIVLSFMIIMQGMINFGGKDGK
jgi:hypothetical protein